MKKSEMIQHIYEELLEVIATRKYSNESDEKYWKRKAASMLDMQLGFGMLPPHRAVGPFEANNTWESEDET